MGGEEDHRFGGHGERGTDANALGGPGIVAHGTNCRKLVRRLRSGAPVCTEIGLPSTALTGRSWSVCGRLGSR